MSKHTPSAPALSFHTTKFHPVARKGQQWLPAAEIAAALGYAREDAISRIYTRHKSEFTDSMAQTVKLTASGNLTKEARIFSLRGAHLLGMFARTERAAEFRRWVLDILDAEAQRQTKPGANALTVQPGLTANLRQRINRKAHEIAVKQYDTIHSFVTQWAEDNLACGATEEDCERYIETAGNLADGTVLMNIRDAQEIVSAVSSVIDAAGSSIAAIKRIEQRSGHDFYHRIEKSKHTKAGFHKHDRLVQEVIDRIAGEVAQ